MKSGWQESGFTVVEILVALSIVGLAAAALISTLAYMRDVLTAVQGDRRYFGQVELLRRVLGEALAQVMPSESAPARMSGNEQSLWVVAAAPRLLSFLDAPIRFTLVPGSDGTGLQASWRAEAATGSGIEYRIFDAGYRTRFSYFTPEGAWAGYWTDRSRLPAAVRVELQRSVEGRGRLELVVPVRAVASAVCAVEPRAASCRAGR